MDSGCRTVVRSSALVLLALVLLLLAAPAAAIGPDPAARGLDVFLHVPEQGSPGGVLPFTVEAFGFATATQPAPLPGATIEAGWDPDSLDGQAPPPSVQATADAGGRVTLALPVPIGSSKEIDLLVSVRHGSHARTRSVKVKRAPIATIEVHTADPRVVPSSTISAWVRVMDTSGHPLADTNVEIALLESDYARHKEKLRTDRGGIAMARVPIPTIDEPMWSWTLRARADLPGEPTDTLKLEPRDETPGQPRLEAAWDVPQGGARPGEPLEVALRLRDAAGEPLVGQDIGFWIGPDSVEAPDDEAWAKVATFVKTDGGGRVKRLHSAPTLVKSSGTRLLLRARAKVEGHALEDTATVRVGQASPTATIALESRELVPGLPQHVHLTVDDARGEPVAGRFEVKGDGLSADVRTDAHGEVEIPWNVPAGIAAYRDTGPCASSVAAAVVVRPLEDLAALHDRRDPFTTCVRVDRDTHAVAHVEPSIARPGETVHVTVESTKPIRTGASVVLGASQFPSAVTAWIAPRPDGSLAGDVVLPDGAAAGVWGISVVTPEETSDAVTASATFLVVPRVLPQLEARRVGGRAAPGGSVEIEARLTDGHGHGLPGAVSAVVMDAFGGGHADVTRLDTRSLLCRVAQFGANECTELLERTAGTETRTRARLGHASGPVLVPRLHPVPRARKDMAQVFAQIVRSVEGAVFESLARPDALVDVRRKVNGRWAMNPELLVLATEAMPEPPLTPGGEPVTLADVVAMDPQVTFDNVARRVTRLELFNLLTAVRIERKNRALDPEEPIFRDPNALLRRLVRSGQLGPSALLDPWGGTIQFVRSAAPQPPFLAVARGWELRAPGPDGVINTDDDVRDPFARVLKSGTPYADAVQEDRIVDAKWDMQVSDETVDAWKRMFEELTGTHLGVNGTGEGGGGSGEGIGLGSIGTLGHGRGGMGVSNGTAFWSAPLRTDADGRVHLSIPLGDVETTWDVALVGVPDGHGPASTVLPVASELPLSARVVAGARWVEGDVIATKIVLRNRTKDPLRTTLHAASEGAVVVDRGSSGDVVVDVPPGGSSDVKVVLRATRAGEARLAITARAPGVPEDTVRHTWEVRPAGERRALTKTDWVDGERDLGLELDHGYRASGTPRLVLERGFDDAIAAALDSLEPERQTSLLGLVDALDAATRIERWALTSDTPRHRALAAIAKSTADRAHARAMAFAKLDHDTWAAGQEPHREWTTRWRLLHLRPSEKDRTEACPPAGERALDAEPAPGPEQPPCWGAFVSAASSLLATETDPAVLADAVNALADRPHRQAVASALATRLRSIVKLRADGEIEVKAQSLSDRASRAAVYAALLRTSSLGASPASASVLFGKLSILRDVTGGYGSSSATLAAARAILASQLEGRGTTRAHVRARGVDRWVDVPASTSVAIALPEGTLDVNVTTVGAGLVARLERPILRSWTRPPPVQTSHASLELEWPTEARAGTVANLRVTLNQDADDTHEVDVRIPLPPGTSIAAHGKTSLAQIQGTLVLRERVARTPMVLEIPIRFGLTGRMTVPEATARLTRAASPAAVAPARLLVVK